MDATKQTLDAFVDGELPPEEMERIAQLLAIRPDLEAYVAQQEKLRSALRMDDVMAAPVPKHLIDTVKNTPISMRWRWRHARPRWLSPQILVATGLAMGLVIGVMLNPPSDIANTSDGLVAHGALAAALDNKLASARYSGQGPRIGISFRNHDGRDCRTFTSGNLAGLACHSGGNWSVATLVTAPREGTGSYRMAGAEMPDVVRQAVQAQIEGAPFDANAEARARAHGWSGK